MDMLVYIGFFIELLLQIGECSGIMSAFAGVYLANGSEVNFPKGSSLSDRSPGWEDSPHRQYETVRFRCGQWLMSGQ